MGASPINLSAGLVPSPPPAPPPTSGIDLSSGLVPAAAPAPAASAPAPPPVAPAAPAGMWQNLKDHTKAFIQAQLDPDNKTSFSAQADIGEQLPVVGDAIAGMRRGVQKGALGTVAGLTHIGAQLVNDFGMDGDVDAYQKANPNATLLEARQAVAPEIYGRQPTAAANAPDFQTGEHKQRVQNLQKTAQWFTQNANTNGFWEGLGSTGETIAELMGGEGLAKLIPAAAPGEAGKVMGIAEKLKATERVASILKANPKLAQLVAMGMRTAHAVSDAAVTRAAVDAGVQTGAQTFVKSGGDVDQTVEGAAMGAAGGALIHGALAGAGKIVRAIAPKVETIAGREVPILRSQITTTAPDGTPVRPTALQEIAATTADSPDVVGQQQAAAAGTVTQEARAVLQREFADANASRAAQTTGAAPPPIEPTTGAPPPPMPAASGTPGSPGIPAGEPGPVDVTGTPIAGRLAEGETGLAVRPNVNVEDTSLPELGAGSPESGMTPSAGSAQPGAAAGTPNGAAQAIGPGSPHARYQLPKIDVQSAINSTHDFGDAADQLHAQGKQVYDRLNDVSGGQWQPADQRIKSLQTKYWKAVGPEREAIARELQAANAQMEKLFNTPNTGISPQVLASAKRMYRSGYLLRDLHNSLEPAYQIDADWSRKSGTYRGFNGSLALSRLRSAMRREPDLKGLLGPQSANNLQEIFHYNVTMAGRKRFGGGVSEVAKWLYDHGGGAVGVGALGTGLGAVLGGKEGAAVGGATAESSYQALKFVLHRVATDPKVGRNLLFAIEGGARPQNYAPLIGRMIVQGAQKYALPVAAGALVRSTQQSAQTETDPEN